jgi:NADPH-dependent 2,4-dienoyl-CoA reductase/sulfur reductase-like enzyme
MGSHSYLNLPTNNQADSLPYILYLIVSLCAFSTMVFKAKRVAVIGAGVSGLASARHLKAAGLEVVVYERSSVSGGVWFVQVTTALSFKG